MNETTTEYTMEPEWVLDEETIEALGQLEEFCSDLVWYARHQQRMKDDPPRKAEDMVAQEKAAGELSLEAALKEAERIEEEHADEVAALVNPETADFAQGFNSGLLAALRFVRHCTMRVTQPGAEGEEDIVWGGVQDAWEEFPDLSV